MPAEVHIVSLVAHVQPAQLKPFVSWLNAQPQLECHASSAEGKVVIVTEGRHQEAVLAAITLIEQQSGVLSCVLVYHEVMGQREAEEWETQ